MNKKLSLLIIVSIIILSFLLRMHDLGGKSLWSDEGMSIDTSKGTILEIINGSDLDPNPPLYYIFLHFWMKLFGDSEFSVRLPSVIFGMLSIYMIYKLGRLIFNDEIGLLSSFVLSISLYHIRYSQETRSYSLLVLIVLLSNYYFIKMLENKERKYIVGYVTSSIVMIYTHVFGLFYLIFQNIYYLIYHKRHIKLWAIIQGIILPFFILLIYILLNNIDRLIEDHYIMSGLKNLPTFGTVYGTFTKFVGNEQVLYMFITVIIMGMIIGKIDKGEINEYKKDIDGDRADNNKRDICKYIFIILWLFIPFVISVVVSYTIGPLYHNRYFIASVPALILLFSKEIFNFRKVSIILFILFILTILQFPLIKEYYQDVQKDQWRDTADYIKNIKGDSDIILLFPDFTKITFGYYYKYNSKYSGIDNHFDIKLLNNTKVWFIYSHIEYQERKKELKLIEEELSKAYVKQETVKFIGIRIDGYNKKDIS